MCLKATIKTPKRDKLTSLSIWKTKCIFPPWAKLYYRQKNDIFSVLSCFYRTRSSGNLGYVESAVPMSCLFTSLSLILLLTFYLDSLKRLLLFELSYISNLLMFKLPLSFIKMNFVLCYFQKRFLIYAKSAFTLWTQDVN